MTQDYLLLYRFHFLMVLTEILPTHNADSLKDDSSEFSRSYGALHATLSPQKTPDEQQSSWVIASTIKQLVAIYNFVVFQALTKFVSALQVATIVQ